MAAPGGGALGPAADGDQDGGGQEAGGANSRLPNMSGCTPAATIDLLWPRLLPGVHPEGPSSSGALPNMQTATSNSP